MMQTLMQKNTDVVVMSCDKEMIQCISKTPDVSKMELHMGQAIAEHQYGHSMYFSNNVKYVTINGKDIVLPFNAWVFMNYDRVAVNKSRNGILLCKTICSNS